MQCQVLSNICFRLNAFNGTYRCDNDFFIFLFCSCPPSHGLLPVSDLSWSWGEESGKYIRKVLLELVIDITGDLGANRQLILLGALSWSFRASDGHSVLQIFWPRWMHLYSGLHLVLLFAPGILPSRPGPDSFYSSAPPAVILNRPMMALPQYLVHWNLRIHSLSTLELKAVSTPEHPLTQ